MDERERRILARIERLRQAAEVGGAHYLASDAPDQGGERCRARRAGFGRRDSATAGSSSSTGGGDGREPERPWPADAPRLDDDLAASLLPARAARGHKGSFGKLLVLAGSLDYAGAALLVCRAAGRTGVGLVTLAVPESLQPLFAAKVSKTERNQRDEEECIPLSLKGS